MVDVKVVGGQNDHQPKVRKKSVPNESGTNRYSRILVTGQNDLQLEMKPRDNITRKL